MAKAKTTAKTATANTQTAILNNALFDDLVRVAQAITDESAALEHAKSERESYSDELFNKVTCLSKEGFSAAVILEALFAALGYSKENPCNDATLRAYKSAMLSVEDGSSKALTKNGNSPKKVHEFASFAELRKYVYPPKAKAKTDKMHPVIAALSQLLMKDPTRAADIAAKVQGIIEEAVKPEAPTKSAKVSKPKTTKTKAAPVDVMASMVNTLQTQKPRKGKAKPTMIVPEQMDEDSVESEIADLFAVSGAMQVSASA